jgi:Na+/proline symporter
MKHLLLGRSEAFYLRFSKTSTILWAAALVGVAYASREVTFVLNAAFSLRGLTSGALLGGLLLALFWRRGGARSVVLGMAVAVATMTAIQVLPQLPATQAWWKRVIGPEIFWPWFTLIGTVVTMGTAWTIQRLNRATTPLRAP